jgi:dihydropteroate synthase
MMSGVPCSAEEPTQVQVRETIMTRADRWRLRTRTLEFGRRPMLMGIVNVTPDSFSDGGRWLDPQAAVDHALRLVDEGADLIDVGGESTRPYARPVTEQEELRRVMPVLERLCGRVPVSIDTFKAAVARRAVEAGCEVINDVSGFRDPAMVEAALAGQTGVCVMHMLGTPGTMQDDPAYVDVVAEVIEYLRERRDALAAAGVARGRICLDPGIGFGKRQRHNLDLLAACRRLHELDCAVLVGHSRKGFIGKVIGDDSADRLPGTIGVACALAAQGVQVIRVHDVAAVRQALALFEAAGGF